ncbi:TPA_asm: E1^E4 [Manis javanica papillomavirus 1]|nr:TPA_asm: E1^E4 [Manis javanica papillomavirus 1]
MDDKKACLLQYLLREDKDKERGKERERGRTKEKDRGRNRGSSRPLLPREGSPAPSPRPTKPPALRRRGRARGARALHATPLGTRGLQGHPSPPQHPISTPPESDEDEEEVEGEEEEEYWDEGDSDKENGLLHQLRHLQKKWDDDVKRLNEEVERDLEGLLKTRETPR